MAKEKLTAGRVRDFALRDGQQQSFLWDTDAPGLAVRATRGAKAYIFEARLNGAKLRVTIGDVRGWGIDQARTEARRLLTLVDQGTDPRTDKAEKIAATEAKRTEAHRQDATVAEAWAIYLEDRRPHWGERYYMDHRHLARPGGEAKRRGSGMTTPGPLAPLMPLKLSDITPERVRGWLQPEAGTRATQARQAFGAFRTFLAWCEDRPGLPGASRPGRLHDPHCPPRVTQEGRQGRRVAARAVIRLVRRRAAHWKPRDRHLPASPAPDRRPSRGAGDPDLGAPGFPMVKPDHPRQGGGRTYHPADPLRRGPVVRPTPPQPVGVQQPRRRKRTAARAAHRPQPRPDRCRTAAPDPARAAPILRHAIASGSRCPPASSPKSWATSRARPRKSTTAAAPWTCCASGTPNWRAGFWPRQESLQPASEHPAQGLRRVK